MLSSIHGASTHDAIHVLTGSKFITIHNHILKAVEDVVISEEEYKLITSELEKYDEGRHKGFATIEAKNSGLGQSNRSAHLLKF